MQILNKPTSKAIFIEKALKDKNNTDFCETKL